MTRLAAVVILLGAAGLLSAGCAKEGCLGNDATCKVVSPCPKVALSCDSGLEASLAVATLETAAARPGGWNGLATKGDVKLSNAFVDVVIAGIGNQNYLDPNGGSILDLAPAGQAKDTVNGIFQVVGVMPGDAAEYTQLELIDERPALVAVQLKGMLDGRHDVKVYTRYELRPCDRGVRVRTEIVNGTAETEMWSLVDGYYWSGRESLPFAPGSIVKEDKTYSGFAHPSFSLLSINDVFRSFPYLAAAGHSSDDAVSAIATASCTAPSLEGFNSDQISAAGVKRTIVPPRGFLTFDRFIAVADSKGVGGAVDVALEVRRQVLGERFATLTGKVERLGALRLDSERETSVLISEGALTTPADKRLQWTQVVPRADGTFSARVPGGKTYVVEVHSFGRKQVEREVVVPALTADDATVPIDTPFTLPATAEVRFDVRDDTGAPLDGEIFVTPVDDAEREKATGTLHGRFTTCSPWLGPPPGASPACNRVLVRSGVATAEVPVGRFHFYAFHGPFWSLARETRTVAPGMTSLSFSLKRLPLQPVDAVSADMHVHGAASFDSSIPDYDRVLSFAASDLEVIIATDHDVVYDYGRIVRQLGLEGRMSTVVGVETTGHIPFMRIPNYGFPLVIGHYNMWPIRFDPSLPRNGGPFDELVEPGTLFSRVNFTGRELIELNHPWADPEFGRDLGYPRALAMDMTKDLPAADDGTAAGMYVRKPAGASYANNAHHAQEVMNGSDNGMYLQYRAFWFYVLNQGQLRTGTANSDSHSLTDNTVGMPRNIVFTTTRPGPTFNGDAFNDAVRKGELLGTNGPIIEATVEETSGRRRSWSIDPAGLFAPRPDGTVKVKVTSAPWVPVEEVRFVVNGKVAKTIGGLAPPADPFATSGDLTRYDGEVPLAELLSGVTGDAWLVVEAGRALPVVEDLGGGLNNAKDGIPDTSDNDGDGKVDAADVKQGSKVGPLNMQPAPLTAQPGYDYYNVTLGHPAAFTNPFVLDRDADGKFSAPGAKGGR